MRVLVTFTVLLACIAAVSCAELESIGGSSWVDPPIDPTMVSAGYIPSSDPTTDPNVDSLLAPVPTIPSDPECTPRPQTIAEALRFRADAAKIAQAIQVEVGIMRKRKQFVSQMTAYLNDRITELNKVKNELAEEVRWISQSQHRIQELAEREKLVKLQDVLACVNAGKQTLDTQQSQKSNTATALAAKAEQIESSVKSIQSKIKSIEEGGK